MIKLGYNLPERQNKSPIGFFKTGSPHREKKKTLQYNGEAHMMTVAPTGAGKGRSNIIPTCLTYKGSLIVLDPKGEAASVTAEARKKFGPVYIIDPFKVVTDKPDRFNPMDTVLPGMSPEQEGMTLADAIQGGDLSISSDPFWDNKASELITAALVNELTTTKSFKSFRKLLMGDDTDYNIAVQLDTRKGEMNRFAYELFATYLQITSDKTRPCVLATAQQHIALLGDPDVLESLDGPTSFSIQDLLDGKTMTVYFVIPPNKIMPYSKLLRLWVISLINLLSTRRSKPELPTLMLIDECGNLGHMKSLLMGVTLLRSYGLRMWMFFQDLGQLKQLYKNDWTTMINNCEMVMSYGVRNMMMAKEVSETFGGNMHQLLAMPNNEALVCLSGRQPFKIKRLDYLKDAAFKNTGFKQNNLYAKKRKGKKNEKGKDKGNENTNGEKKV